MHGWSWWFGLGLGALLVAAGIAETVRLVRSGDGGFWFWFPTLVGGGVLVLGGALLRPRRPMLGFVLTTATAATHPIYKIGMPRGARRHAGDGTQAYAEQDAAGEEDADDDHSLTQTGPVVQGSVVGHHERAHEHEAQQSQGARGGGIPGESAPMVVLPKPAREDDQPDRAGEEEDHPGGEVAAWVVGDAGRVLPQRERRGQQATDAADADQNRSDVA